MLAIVCAGVVLASLDLFVVNVARLGDARFVAEVLTAAAHGAVSLELSHYFWSKADAGERYATLTRAASQAFAPQAIPGR